MAEAVVGVLIGKLGAALAKETAPYGASLLCREVSSLKGLFREIRKAERELESMKAYLRESETFKDIDQEYPGTLFLYRGCHRRVLIQA
jgi:disease resistance protein RPM1